MKEILQRTAQVDCIEFVDEDDADLVDIVSNTDTNEMPPEIAVGIPNEAAFCKIVKWSSMGSQV